VLIHSSYYDTYVENDPEFEKDVIIIAKDIEVKKKVEKKVEDLPNVLKEPFVVYLSGIDTRGGGMPERGLSDVNMIMVINPKTHKVLMVNIPRDYYVQLYGTTGLKDKLTHAGMNGGVSLSIATIESILDIKVDYYLRVNFNAVVNLVDAIGGLTINSDVNYAFTCWTDHDCIIYPGDNQVGGKCALAFARERHAYETGDRHRGENQQQVIRLIMDKVGSSKELLNNYSSILNALDGTFETNFSSDNVKDLVRHQIDKMPRWEVITSNLDGSGAMKPTYSYPNQDLSVMIPDQTTIDTAKAKIKEVLNEK
jgi:LCP family protein required for cell wall assembly